LINVVFVYIAYIKHSDDFKVLTYFYSALIKMP